MLVELSVVEQRYHAVMEVVVGGAPVTEVAERYGVSRKSVHTWINRYRSEGLTGLADRSHRPEHHPWQLVPEVEAMICEMRRAHPRWGPRRLRHELARTGAVPVASLSTIYRVVKRRGLVSAVPRKRRREDYRRWERPGPMQLWQMDIMGSVMLTDGTECKLISGIDDHSRYCVIATVVARATARAVCTAFVTAMEIYGIPEEVLTDNGKQFTGNYGRPRPAEVVFDRICRHNGIGHLLTKIRYPTTIGKVERWHQSIQTDLLDGHGGFADLAAAQDAVQAWRIEYNTVRPHQSLGMATPAQRFAPIPARQRAALTLWRPPELAAAPPGDDDVTHEPPQTPTAPVLTQPPTRPALDRIVGRASGPTSRPGQSGWPPTG
jgi:transposase InsO family protein